MTLAIFDEETERQGRQHDPVWLTARWEHVEAVLREDRASR